MTKTEIIDYSTIPVTVRLPGSPVELEFSHLPELCARLEVLPGKKHGGHQRLTGTVYNIARLVKALSWCSGLERTAENLVLGALGKEFRFELAGSKFRANRSRFISPTIFYLGEDEEYATYTAYTFSTAAEKDPLKWSVVRVSIRLGQLDTAGEKLHVSLASRILLHFNTHFRWYPSKLVEQTLGVAPDLLYTLSRQSSRR